MMKRPDRITAAFGAVVLAAVVGVGAFSASAVGGDQNDPLVTLSYLTNVFTESVLEKVDEQIAANELELTDSISSAIDDYSAQMEYALSQGVAESASFVSVTVTKGKLVYPAAGTEILLSSGKAAVAGGKSPVLLDTTAGSSLNAKGNLQANHLYVVAQEEASISISQDAVLLIRGSYDVSEAAS